MPTLSPTAPTHFVTDLNRLNQAFERAGAILPARPDGFVGLDPFVLPALQDVYCNLLSYGWANGWLIP